MSKLKQKHKGASATRPTPLPAAGSGLVWDSREVSQEIQDAAESRGTAFNATAALHQKVGC